MSGNDDKTKKHTVKLDYELKDAKGRAMRNLKMDDRGDPILIEVREDGRPIYEREPVTMKDIVIAVLSNPTPQEVKAKGMKGRKAAKMRNLANHILDKSKFSFSVSQVSLICNRVEAMYAENPGVMTEVLGKFDWKTTKEMDDFDE